MSLNNTLASCVSFNEVMREITINKRVVGMQMNEL